MSAWNFRQANGPAVVAGLVVLALLVLLVFHVSRSNAVGRSFEVLRKDTFASMAACEVGCTQQACEDGRETAGHCLPSGGRFECVPVYRDCACCGDRCC